MDKYVFIYVCTKCKRRHYTATNTLPPFAQREHKERYFCTGTLKPKGSEIAATNVPRYVG